MHHIQITQFSEYGANLLQLYDHIPWIRYNCIQHNERRLLKLLRSSNKKSFNISSHAESRIFKNKFRLTFHDRGSLQAMDIGYDQPLKKEIRDYENKHFCTFCLKKKYYRKLNQYLNTLNVLVTNTAKFSRFFVLFFLTRYLQSAQLRHFGY